MFPVRHTNLLNHTRVSLILSTRSCETDLDVLEKVMNFIERTHALCDREVYFVNAGEKVIHIFQACYQL